MELGESTVVALCWMIAAALAVVLCALAVPQCAIGAGEYTLTSGMRRTEAPGGRIGNGRTWGSGAGEGARPTSASTAFGFR